ncbi:MAG: ATPase domain-containing protein [Candidatus Bathyarchaeia archaeon]
MFDGVIEMRFKEDKEQLKREIRIYSLKSGRHDSSWHEFQITDKGIKIIEMSTYQKS